MTGKEPMPAGVSGPSAGRFWWKPKVEHGDIGSGMARGQEEQE
jgi:hypothetical protein